MNLDTPQTYTTLDTQNQLGSIELLHKQLQHAFEIGSHVKIPDSYSQCKRIVFSGMGGSSLGAYVIKHVFALGMKVPYDIWHDYHLPAYVDESTLVIVQSYSGNTEESLSCFTDAQHRGACILTISAGGELEKRAQQHGNPHFHMDPIHNPCNQPRMAIGYSIGSQISLLRSLGYILCDDEVVNDCVQTLTLQNDLYGPRRVTPENPVKKLAQTCLHRVPLYIGGEFLQASIHAMRNQFHENAKSFAVEHPIPEMNHHLLEALPFPASFKETALYLFLESDLYSQPIQERIKHSSAIVQGEGYRVEHIKARGKHALSQVFSTIHMGAYMGLYVAMLEGIDPSPIPHVEALKKQLAK